MKFELKECNDNLKLLEDLKEYICFYGKYKIWEKGRKREREKPGGRHGIWLCEREVYY